MAYSETFYPARFPLQGVQLELFSEDDMRAIHYASMEVFMNPGIQVSDPEARAIFKEAGCEVDEKTQVVKIPEFLVNRALIDAPSRFLLYGRDKKNTVDMEHKGKVHWIPFGTGVKMCNYVAPGKYETVDSVEQDIADTAKVCDYLDGFSYFALTVSARDWAGKGMQDVHETLTPLANTTKHFHHIDPVGENVEYYKGIVDAYYGGDSEEARKKPIFSMLLCPTSPLELSVNACQVIIKGAKFGMPVNVLSMAMSGGSSPVFRAGTLVTHNAEILAGIVLAQLVQPGSAVFYGSSTTTFDLRKGTAPVGAPELGLISAAVGKMGQFYGLPTYVAGT
jgi:trimethylamine--corrinoid protein Co-methyltransferase